jgi:ATP-dependent Clp protease ATP-binding subunit ClpA
MTMDRFDKFTDRARKAMTLAQDEAQRFNHNYIGTEHLLLGLLREGEGVAARVLENLGADLAKIRTATEFIIGRGDRPVSGEVGLTPRGRRTIELAIDEARRLGHNYIGTEHLLLGLVREGEGIAAGVLESVGINLDKVRQETIRVLGARSEDVKPKKSAQPPSAPMATPRLDGQRDEDRRDDAAHGSILIKDLANSTDQWVRYAALRVQPYRKTDPTYAVQIEVPFEVDTLEGLMTGKAMDYLALGPDGEAYPVDRAIFEGSYVLIEELQQEVKE